ncbi:MAG: acetylornithine transaminase [Micropruina sp.]|nr:acetylornithine transaminase [Micropruina sp.]
MTTSQERYGAAMMNTFGPPKRVFVKGLGTRLIDDQGREYLDLLGGLAVNALGHAHPVLVAAVTEQLQTLGHISNFFASEPQIALGERLGRLATANSPGARALVFLTNSGTEANEVAFKVSRRTGRTRLIAMGGSFHGRTMGSLALTANPAYRQPFEPLPGDVTFVPFGDADALAAALDETIAAVVIEPIQGENGVVVPPPDFLARARELTTQAGALLWLDEVQTGIGRCGQWLAHLPTGVTADLVTVAKGLGGGIPIGACIGVGEAATLLGPGSHGNTFGGNPPASAAALAVLDYLESADVLAHVLRAGEHLVAAIEGLGHPLISHVRGAGLLRGIVLNADIAPALADVALEAGFVVNAPRPGVIRLAPPLIITEEELDEFVAALPGLLAQASR